jgi:hypothetical protein
MQQQIEQRESTCRTMRTCGEKMARDDKRANTASGKGAPV